MSTNVKISEMCLEIYAKKYMHTETGSSEWEVASLSCSLATLQNYAISVSLNIDKLSTVTSCRIRTCGVFVIDTTPIDYIYIIYCT